MSPARLRILAALLTVLLVGGAALVARCASVSMASCTPSTLFGGGPKLDVPYAVTRPEAIAKMLDMARVGPNDRVVDLGTGDGRIALAAARRGATVLGVDIDPVLVARANASARTEGLADRARFETRDLFKMHYGDTTVVTMYLLPKVNLALRPRLLAELPPGARVVSHAFDMGDWPPDATARVGGPHLYLWIVPARVEGRWRLTDSNGAHDLVLTRNYSTLSGTLDGAGIDRAGSPAPASPSMSPIAASPERYRTTASPARAGAPSARPRDGRDRYRARARAASAAPHRPAFASPRAAALHRGHRAGASRRRRWSHRLTSA